MSKSKLGLVVGLVALAVPLFAATGAEASTAACVFNGATGEIDPNEAPLGTPPVGDIEAGDPVGLPVDAGVQSLRQDARKGDVQGDFDGGGYRFSTKNIATGQTVCAVNSPATGTVGVFLGHISSKGHYNNRVCGTGTAIDDDSLPGQVTTVDLNPQNPPDPTQPPEDIHDADYTLDFEAGTGPLDVTDIQLEPTSAELPEIDSFPGNTPPEAGGRADVDGVVNIAPIAGDCVNTDVSTFLAAGSFAVEWLP